MPMTTMPFIALIKGAALTNKPAGTTGGKVWRYGFQQITTPFTQDYGVINVNVAEMGQPQEGKLAVLITDINRDASDDDPQKPPLANNTVVCILYCNGTPYIISGFGLQDVRYSPEDDRFYKTLNGVEQEWAKSTQYPPTESSGGGSSSSGNDGGSGGESSGDSNNNG